METRCLKLFLLALSFLSSLAFSNALEPDPNMTWQQKLEYKGEVCNDTNQMVIVHQALIPDHGPSEHSHTAQLKYWYKVKPKQCLYIVESYLYAQTESGGLRWEQITHPSKQACVPLDCNATPKLTCEKNWDFPQRACPKGSRKSGTFFLKRKNVIRLSDENAIRGPAISRCLTQKEKDKLAEENKPPTAFDISKKNMEKHESLLEETSKLHEQCFDPAIDEILETLDIFKVKKEQLNLLSECDPVLVKVLKAKIAEKKESTKVAARELIKKSKDVQNHVKRTFLRNMDFTNLRDDAARIFGYQDITYGALSDDGKLDAHDKTLTGHRQLKSSYVEREDLLGVTAGFYNYYDVVQKYSLDIPERLKEKSLGFNASVSFFESEKKYAAEMLVGVSKDLRGYHLENGSDSFDKQMATFIELDPVYGEKLRGEVLALKSLKLWTKSFIKFFQIMADLNEQALLEKAENERDKSLYEYAQKSVEGTYEFAKYLNSPSFKRHMRQMANRSGEAAKKLADDFKNMNSEAKKCLAMSFVPYAGDSMDVYEVSTGLDACTGEKLSEEQRRISMAATLFGSGAFMRKVAESLGWIKNGAGGLSASKVEDVVNETSELYTDIAKVVGKDRAREVYNSAKKYGFSSSDKVQGFAKNIRKSPDGNFSQVLYPRGPGASSGPVPSGHTKVSRWMSDAEVKAWYDGGGTRIPPDIGANSRLYVTKAGAPKPGGTGNVRVDFNVPDKMLQKAGNEQWHQILQPEASTPIYNVEIFLP